MTSVKDKEVAWPTGTLLLAGSCLGVFLLISLGRFKTALDHVLYFEADMQPSEWLTALFIHANPVQLAGCLLFLLVFGALVEVRLGWKLTIAVFVGLGAAGHAVAQMALLDANSGGVTLGAAAGIWGLAALLLIWNPRDQVTKLGPLPLGQRGVPLWGLLAGWLVVDLVLYLGLLKLGGVGVLPHVLGLAAGLGLGVVLMKNKMVDCQQQDLLTLLTGRTPGGRRERRQKAEAEQKAQAEEQQTQRLLAEAQEQLERYLNAEQLAAALTLIDKMKGVAEGLHLSREQLLKIIHGLHKRRQWQDSIPWLDKYLERYPEDVPMRLKLAQIFIADQRRPGSGMEVLQPLEGKTLSEADEKLRQKLEHAACNMYEEDDIELEIKKRSW